MPAHNPGLVYLSETVALHVHGYAGKMWLDRRRVRLQPGDFTLTPARMRSHYDLDAAGHHLCLHFAPLPVKAGALRLPLHWRPGPHVQRLNERLQEIIHLLHQSAGDTAGSRLAHQAAGTALQALLLWLAVTVGPGRPVALAAPTRVDGALDEVRRILDEHYREPLRIPELARRAGVSQNHLARRFRARHGMTLQRYVLGRRVELARHLLATTQLPLKAVAVESGLGNPQYFHRQFRRATGHSPSEERAVSRVASA
jgi:AraC-like DNA-binding protein